MNRFLTAAVTAVLMSTAGLAAAQRVDTDIDNGWVGDEPNTDMPGSLPFCFPMDPRKPGHQDPSCDYPADSNGLGEDRASTGTPGTVLAVMWRSQVSAAGGYTTGALTRNLGESMILPGMGQFRAWFGTYQDLNDDGWIDVGSASAAGVSTRGGCTQETHAGDDPNGLGAAHPAGGERINSGVSVRCDRPDEWTPGPATVIVAYVTPGDYNGNADVPNGPRGFISNDTSTPDFTFQGAGNGQYFSPASNFEYVVIDNSMLETSVLEAISDPETILNGERTKEAGSSSLVEVDVFTSVNPALEALYQTNVIAPLNSVGCDVDWTTTTNRCPMMQDFAGDAVDAAADPAVDAVEQALEDAGVNDALEPVFDAIDEATSGVPPTDPVVGPLGDRASPAWEEETAGDYADGPHIYLDQRLISGTNSVSGGATHLQNNGFTSTAPGTGAYNPHTQTELHARIGIWHDKNADGYIGVFVNDGADDGCPDPYDCGNRNDLNNYGDTNEFFSSVCGAKQTTEGDKSQGVYIAELTSSTGTWGSGVYVLTDRRDAGALTNPEDESDGLMDDGRSPFNPYDDILVDASDGSLDTTIVTSGPIHIHMLCSGSSGTYNGYERMVFLDGTNQGYDIHVTGTVAGDFTAQGVPIGETRTDNDVVPTFSL